MNRPSFFACFFILTSCVTAPHVPPTVSPVVAQPKFETQILEWEFDGNPGTRITTNSWDIYTTLPYDHILDSLPLFYEELMEHYTSIFTSLPFPSERLEVFLFSDDSQWKIKLQEILGREAQHWFQLGRGGLTIDGTAVLYDLDRRGRSRTTFRIAAHEGWHQYAEAVFKTELPTWLDEGIGTWMEGFRLRRGSIQFEPTNNWDRLNALRQIVRADRLTPLSDLLQDSPSDLLGDGRSNLLSYYAQLWGFVNYLFESNDGKYKTMLEDLLQEFAFSKPSRTQSWLEYFSTDTESFEQDYREWVEQFVQPGSSWRL